MSLLVPKNRRTKFKVTLLIEDLSNVPLVSGLVHVRWHLRDSIRSESRGKTERAPIQDHKVEWDYSITWNVRITIDKSNTLQESFVEFEVFQELYGGKERHALGKLGLNLAEYADSSEAVSRRYLLHQSKVNSTLKVSIRMDQISGDSDFRTPELKKPQVFAGITGLLGEGKEMKRNQDESGFGDEIEETADKVAADLDQDIYRNSMTRRWQAQAGELDPADVVEDIFNGGDGWVRPYDDEADLSSRHGRRNRSRRGRVPGVDHDDVDDDEDEDDDDDDRTMHKERGHGRTNFLGRSEFEEQRKLWIANRQGYEADEMLRSIAWSIDPHQVERHVNKSLEEREEELLA